MVVADSKVSERFPPNRDAKVCPQEYDGLLRQAQAGDPDAFCQLAAGQETFLYRQAVALCRDEHLAEDLVSETLTEAWRSLRRFDRSCRLSTWLYAILLHRHYKQCRRSRRRPIPLSLLDDPTAAAAQLRDKEAVAAEASPADQAMGTELGEWLQRAICQLPEKHRRVILLRFFADASLEEIAVALDCSIGTVKSRLHHALEKLRRQPEFVNLRRERRDL